MKFFAQWTLVAAFVLAMLPLTSYAADTITLTTSDDEKAASELSTWIGDNGYEITASGDTWFKVQGDHLTLIMMPKLTNGNLDRIVVRVYLIVDKDYASNSYSDLVSKVMTLNATYNIGIWSLDEDNDIVFEGYMTFVDELALAEIKAYMAWFEGAILEVFGSNEDLYEILADE